MTGEKCGKFWIFDINYCYLLGLCYADNYVIYMIAIGFSFGCVMNWCFRYRHIIDSVLSEQEMLGMWQLKLTKNLYLEISSVCMCYTKLVAWFTNTPPDSICLKCFYYQLTVKYILLFASIDGLVDIKDLATGILAQIYLMYYFH